MEKVGFSLSRTLTIMGLAGLTMCAIAVLCEQSQVLSGLIIGILTSCLYQMLIYFQLKRCAGMTPKQIDLYLKKGALSRFCLVLVGILAVLHDPGASIIGFIAGFLVPFRLVICFNILVFLFREFAAPQFHDLHRYDTCIKHPLLRGHHYTHY